MPVEYDDRGLRIYGHNVKGIQFFDPGRVLRQEIFLQENNKLNTGDTGLEGEGAAATGGMIAHDLSGGYHTGTLSSAQAPQFLLTDGARNLTGDLLAAGTVEVQFRDSDLAIYSSADGQLDLKADTEIELTAPTVDVQGNITVTGTVDTVDIQNHSARHNPGGSDALTTAAPSANLSVTTSNAEGNATSFARSNHSHGITTSSNPGANARILASDSDGKLELEGLGIGGAPGDAAIDIIETSIGHMRFTRVDGDNYTDWNMSSNTVLETDIYNASADVYWRIKNSHASYRTHIGLNCDGDAQFDLDIGGNLRAQGWIVGKHAIQLEGALLICHYDGPEPFETNYAGTCTGHMGQVATTSGGVIFQPGKFQKGVQIAEATTNLYTNPSAETNTAGWACANGVLSRSPTNSHFRFGMHSFKCVFDGVGNGAFYDSTTPKANPAQGETYTVSCGVYALGDAIGKTLMVTCRETGGATGTEQTTENYTLVAGWQHVRATHTILQTDRTGVDANMTLVSAAANDTLYFDGCQFEQKAYPTPYCDGSLGLIADGAWRDGEPGTEGHYWSGTAHASTSTRVAAKLSYDASLINVNTGEGTALLWFYGYDLDTVNNFLFSLYKDADNRVEFYINTSGYLAVYTENATVSSSDVTALSPTAGQWNFAALVWDGTTYTTYLNGSSEDNGTLQAVPAGCDLWVALRGNGEDSSLNGFVDEFALTDNAMSADEVRAIYESEAPVFAETSTFQFSAGPDQLIWADHEGLWARDTAGEAALGLFCGEGTKSWGGFTMGPSDLVLGANVSGSSAIHWDQSTGKFGFYGNANATVQVEIDTDGSIVAGAGDVMLNASGITIVPGNADPNILKWENSSNIMPMAIYATTLNGDGLGYVYALCDDSTPGTFSDLMLYASAGAETGTPTSPVSGFWLSMDTDASTSSKIAFLVHDTTVATMKTAGLGIGTATQFGSGVGVIGIANAGTNPSANPTGGGVLYADAGAGKWRGSGGTTTTFGPAEPHCPRCGRDFVMEWENPETGHLIVCMWCLSEELGVREYITRKH